MIKKVTFNFQTVVGATIALHGLARIVFIDKYVDFVLYNFSEILAAETALVIGAVLFPFIEFFIGSLIIFNVGIQEIDTGGYASIYYNEYVHHSGKFIFPPYISYNSGCFFIVFTYKGAKKQWF